VKQRFGYKRKQQGPTRQHYQFRYVPVLGLTLLSISQLERK
jgi:hypothetical protein